MRLSDVGFNLHSQFGEDGMIAKVFELIGERSRHCVEFGAADGASCSNTQRLRLHGWSSLLIEGDPQVYWELENRCWRSRRDRLTQAYVTPENVNDLVTGAIDLMSIDVDGDDYVIFEAMTARPRLLLVEYNGSVPPHLSVRQAANGSYFGASARALVDLAESKGYGLVGLTKGNLFFVQDEDLHLFADYDRDLHSIFDHSTLSYLATDYAGQPIGVGPVPPWGIASTSYVGGVIGEPSFAVAAAPIPARDAYEVAHGMCRWVRANWRFNVAAAGEGTLGPTWWKELLSASPRTPILMDISQHSVDTSFEWICLLASSFRFRNERIPGAVLALIPEENP